MNAPDKIYFPADGLPAYSDWDGSPIRTKKMEDTDICYIRKDALLEWLEGSKKEMVKELEGSNGVIRFATGIAISSFQEVIDKLNSF